MIPCDLTTQNEAFQLVAAADFPLTQPSLAGYRNSCLPVMPRLLFSARLVRSCLIGNLAYVAARDDVGIGGDRDIGGKFMGR